jgi:hypothetical protein
MTKELGFNSQHGQDFPLLHRVQASSGAHTASYAVGTMDSFPGVKAVGV